MPDQITPYLPKWLPGTDDSFGRWDLGKALSADLTQVDLVTAAIAKMGVAAPIEAPSILAELVVALSERLDRERRAEIAELRALIERGAPDA